MSQPTVENELKVVLMYTDSTTRQYTLPEVPSTLTTEIVRGRVNEINSSLEAGQDQDFQQTFISNSGAGVHRIASAALVTKIEEVIYSG